jgi:hypothetical protein
MSSHAPPRRDLREDSMLQTKCLVVGSCTGQKDDEGCPEELKLKEADFGAAANLSKAEHKARDWMKPAGNVLHYAKRELK